MKNILVVQGDGRPNENTAQLINSFVKGAIDAGHTVEVISLIKNEVKISGQRNASRWWLWRYCFIMRGGL